MRLLRGLAIIVLALGLFFWSDIFGGGDDDDQVVVVAENLDAALVIANETSPAAPDAAEHALAGTAGADSGGAGAAPEPSRQGREPQADAKLADLLHRGCWQEALDTLEARRPRAHWTAWELAAHHRCLANLGKPKEAEAALDALLALDPLPAEAVDTAIEAADALADPIAQRRLLSRVAPGFGALRPELATRVADLLAAANRSLPQSIAGLFEFDSYTIRPNDNLWEICNEYNRRSGLNVEVGLVRWLNAIKGNGIYPDQVLKLPTQKVSLRVWKPSWLLGVFLGDTLLAAYPVGLGRDNKTPGGSFVIQSKLEHPTWKGYPPGDPSNILGTRWLGFRNTPQYQGYGLHGTKHPESIGKNESDGCIRLLNEDVEELFDLVSRGTIVEIL